MVNHKYADQLAAMKPLCRSEYETKHYIEKLCSNEALCRNEYAKKVIDSYKFEYFNEKKWPFHISWLIDSVFIFINP